MRVPGEVFSETHAQIILLKVQTQDFWTIRRNNCAEVGDTQVQALRQSSEEKIEGETFDGRPVVILKGKIN